MDPAITGPLTYVLATVAAAGVGLLAGLLGLGGGFLLVPVLNVILGLPMQMAVGAAACQALGPATTFLRARRVRREEWRLPAIITGGLFIGVFAGATVLHQASQAGADSSTGSSRADVLVLSVYCVLLLALGIFSIWESRQAARFRPLTPLRLGELPVPPWANFPDDFPHSMSIPVLTWFGLLLGFLSGLLGISGGLLLLPGLIYLFGLPTRRAINTSMVTVWIVSAQSTLAHAWHEHIEIPIVLCLLLGGTIGARIGSELGQRILGTQLRGSFGWLALGTGTFVGARLVWLLMQR
ncbi:Sulfite exporter TauE/SafE [Maioricimonas rarisocia]|uniref:Probable membrane transporter protein n=1 Tax=Maioricimonas rarisocia TaxID=2528026 RepID=A0A517ZBX9_9PLAN|nr:sulfite exporter TauE/SafE family protein [Maioricimonas rarisocia]QDU39949.1 Sulfite exporter TauE/SafE [Maioricimonas rarisocia]